MQKYDASLLAAALNKLADTFEKKPVSAGALEVWFDTLREFPTERVLGIIGSWAKHHGKFPTPNDVWKTVNEIGIDEREKVAAQERHQARAPVMFKKTEAGKRALAEIKRTLGPKPTPLESWHRCLSLNAPGSYPHDLATSAIARLTWTPKVDREPGDDELEAA